MRIPGRHRAGTTGWLVAVLVLGACSGGQPVTDEPVRRPAPSSARPGGPTGGCAAALGPSTGPAAASTSVVVRTAAEGVAGSALEVSAQLRSVADGQRVLLRPAGSGVALVRAGRVVAWVTGSGPVVPLTPAAGRTRPAQVLPTSLPLSATGGGPLPAGSYEVVAVVGYTGDDLPGPAAAADEPAAVPGASGRCFHLVSAPVPLRVRAAGA